MADESSIKVSVVVATYRPGEGLDRVIRSLDAQSLPSDEWEAIFVDDGSPDDTYERLQQLAETRPNMRVTRIQNSGWPSRPRNVGTAMARGEYVAYMDHDDQLYPNALRDGHAFAAAAGADVLNGKEARTNDPEWGISSFQADLPQAKFRTDVHPLIPANPHKMYRRAFLDQHGIRFREGDGGRVMWEDIFFNLQVARHADVISTMSSTPYYHWYETARSGSTTFDRTTPAWWGWLDEVMRAIDDDLAEPDLQTQRALMRRQQYRGRLMPTFNDLYPRRPKAERTELFAAGRTAQSAHFAATDDAELTGTYRLRAQLLRKGDRTGLERLITATPIVPAAPRAIAASFVDGLIAVELETRWADAAGRGPRHRMRDGRVVVDLPRRLASAFDPLELDVTDDIRSATVEIGVRSQSSRVCWMVPSDSQVRWHDEGRTPDFTVDATARIDPATAAMGRPLTRGVWHLTARATYSTAVHHRMVRGRVTPAIHLDAHGSAAVYTRSDGYVVLDHDQTGASLSALVQVTGAVRRDGARVVLDVTGLPVVESWSGATKVEVDVDGSRRVGARWSPLAAELRVEGDRGQLILQLPTDSPVRVRIGQHRPDAASAFVLDPERLVLRPVRDGLAPLRRAARPAAGLWNRTVVRMHPTVDRVKRRARRMLRKLRARR
jgi:glycosyltransferase involved in cell wall biosynthesis